MPHSLILIPASVTGTSLALAARKATASGPSGEDTFAEVGASLPENAVGATLFSVPYGSIPATLTQILANAIAVELLLLVNTSADFLDAHVETHSGLVLVHEKIPPGRMLIKLDGLEFDGLSWSAAAGVNGALKGYTV